MTLGTAIILVWSWALILALAGMWLDLTRGK